MIVSNLKREILQFKRESKSVIPSAFRICLIYDVSINSHDKFEIIGMLVPSYNNRSLDIKLTAN